MTHTSLDPASTTTNADSSVAYASPIKAAPDHAMAAQDRLKQIAPGLLIILAIAVISMTLRQATGVNAISPLILSILIGMMVRARIDLPESAAPGISFAMRPMLRAGIVLLGLQLTFEQVLSLGAHGIAVTIATVLASFAFTKLIGHWLGVERKLTELIAAGTAICGASAVIATNSVTRAEDEDVAYAIASVTVFGSLSMLIFPMLLPVLQLSAHDFGLWTGSSIHEIGQVLAAAYQGGHEAGEFGTLVKLSRIILLAPMVAFLSHSQTSVPRNCGQSLPSTPIIPWFVLGFLGMIGLNSLGLFPGTLKPWLSYATTVMLACGLAAMGLETSMAKLRAKGLAPMLLAALAWLFISVFSLALIKLMD